jgi:hypothetical protein
MWEKGARRIPGFKKEGDSIVLVVDDAVNCLLYDTAMGGVREICLIRDCMKLCIIGY